MLQNLLLICIERIVGWRYLKINNRLKVSVAVLLIFFAFCSNLSQHYAFAQTDQAASEIKTASNVVNEAFNSVWTAEKDGANVTVLLNQLNNATELLAQAENAYNSGDLDIASFKAQSAVPIAQQVSSEAQNYEQTALTSSKNSFIDKVVFTSIASLVFILVLFLIWRQIKNRYIKNLNVSKPVMNAQ